MRVKYNKTSALRNKEQSICKKISVANNLLPFLLIIAIFLPSQGNAQIVYWNSTDLIGDVNKVKEIEYNVNYTNSYNNSELGYDTTFPALVGKKYITESEFNKKRLVIRQSFTFDNKIENAKFLYDENDRIISILSNKRKTTVQHIGESVKFISLDSSNNLRTEVVSNYKNGKLLESATNLIYSDTTIKISTLYSYKKDTITYSTYYPYYEEVDVLNGRVIRKKSKNQQEYYCYVDDNLGNWIELRVYCGKVLLRYVRRSIFYFSEIPKVILNEDVLTREVWINNPTNFFLLLKRNGSYSSGKISKPSKDLNKQHRITYLENTGELKFLQEEEFGNWQFDPVKSILKLRPIRNTKDLSINEPETKNYLVKGVGLIIQLYKQSGEIEFQLEGEILSKQSIEWVDKPCKIGKVRN
jgi:hypothetical protein